MSCGKNCSLVVFFLYLYFLSVDLKQYSIDIFFLLSAKMPEVFKDYQFPSARIVGGLTLKGSLPYQLKLVWREDLFDGSHTCGATLISSKYAISAAHCFYQFSFSLNSEDEIEKFRLEMIEVVAGAYNNTNNVAGAYNNTNQGLQKRNINRFIKKFPSSYFSFDSQYADFVILEFDTPFNLIEGLIQPACLPTKPVKARDRCFTSGWGSISGSTSFGEVATVLKATKVMINDPIHWTGK